MKHASVGIALSTIAFALVLAATEALGDSRSELLDERIATGAGDHVDRQFPDGSSLTVWPRAALTIDRFVYDPDTRSGDLAVNVSQGVLRVVGGRISRTNPIVIGTPSSTLTLRGGIAILSVTPTSTIAILLAGEEMKVVANGQTRSVSRPGWQVTTHAGMAPGAPAQTPQGSLAIDIGAASASTVDQAALNTER